MRVERGTLHTLSVCCQLLNAIALFSLVITYAIRIPDDA